MTSGAPLNAQQTIAAIREGTLTVSDELRRVTERARQCQVLNALTWFDEQAAQSDSARQAQHCPSLPLAGLPIVVKDNIDVAGMPTSLGTRTLATEIVGKNAVIIDKLASRGNYYRQSSYARAGFRHQRIKCCQRGYTPSFSFTAFRWGIIWR